MKLPVDENFRYSIIIITVVIILQGIVYKYRAQGPLTKQQFFSCGCSEIDSFNLGVEDSNTIH